MPKTLLRQMIAYLVQERGEELPTLPDQLEELERIWRGLINQRPAQPISSAYLEREDAYLTQRPLSPMGLEACQQTDHPSIYLYKGDICHLSVDGIVNAANSVMLGCFIPNHGCIDNAIHTFAGYRLRLACQDLMKGKKEAVGGARLTPAFHLPAKYVLHTVGPYIGQGQAVSPIRANLLRQSYLSCLKLAQEEGLKSLAFCAISTGEFGFPKDQARQIAVETVSQWLTQTETDLQVIFDLFSQEDYEAYEQELMKKRRTDATVDTFSQQPD